ncbi:MAG: hypothetical protein IKW74_02835 [Thermoguttaceae bacterium]|nr:hypothetical protein [Thermoguttaceae bacterium]
MFVPWTGLFFIVFLLLSRLSVPARADGIGEVEGQIAAKDVQSGQILLNWTADQDKVLSGFYIRLTNCLASREEPVVAAVRVHGKMLEERVEIPAFTYPLGQYVRPFTHSPENCPSLDVAREYRQGINPPIAIKKGETVQLEIVSAPAMKSGVTGGLQFQGKHLLASMRNPFRDCRTNGPVCRIPWSKPEIIAVGNQKKFDPLCAPQNNSSVIDDKDGTLYQFTAYYSVDEQYGGGRDGSYSRIYGYKKMPGSDHWEPMGLIVDLQEGSTYSGDPFVFRDLDGRPSLVFTVCDGTRGFIDWGKGGNMIMQSTTDSFAGPWGEPTYLWRDYPREPDDNKTGGRANCLRIYPRVKTGDYLVVWNHGAQDKDIRGIVVPDLKTEITHEQVNTGQLFSVNEEEGGGGCTVGDKGYYSTWQIPGLNDPNGVQRLYEIDLTGPITPESWRVVPGSLGCNDGANPTIDGGCTADAWAFSVIGNEIWATACEYSKTENLNYLVARHAPLDPENQLPQDGVFRYGAVRSDVYPETFPTVEYAIGEQCSLEFDFRSFGELSYGFITITPSDSPAYFQELLFEINTDGCHFVAYKGREQRILLTDYVPPVWKPDTTYHLKLTRNGNRLTAFVDGQEIQSVEITDPELIENLNNNPRFRLYGWQGGSYEISNAVLTDGE